MRLGLCSKKHQFHFCIVVWHLVQAITITITIAGGHHRQTVYRIKTPNAKKKLKTGKLFAARDSDDVFFFFSFLPSFLISFYCSHDPSQTVITWSLRRPSVRLPAHHHNHRPTHWIIFSELCCSWRHTRRYCRKNLETTPSFSTWNYDYDKRFFLFFFLIFHHWHR